MGLDMYAYKSKHKPDRKCNFRDYEMPDTDVTYDRIEKGDEELFYWRKHPNLHGWMQELYIENGGYIRGGGPVVNIVEELPEDEWVQFNGNSVELDLKDLDRLEEAVNNEELPETIGFFFGKSHPSYKYDDLNFIKAARSSIEEGFYVYYTSSW